MGRVTYERRVEITDELFNTCKDLCARKNADYAPGADTLHNFKHGAQIARTTPFSFLINLVSKQFGAIATAVEKAPDYPQTSTEHLRDKIIDVINYMVLFECLLEEYKPDPEIDEAFDVAKFLISCFTPELTMSVNGTPLREVEEPEAVQEPNRNLYRRLHDGSLCEYVGLGAIHGTLKFKDLTDGETFERDMQDLKDLEPVTVPADPWKEGTYVQDKARRVYCYCGHDGRSFKFRLMGTQDYWWCGDAASFTVYSPYENVSGSAWNKAAERKGDAA